TYGFVELESEGCVGLGEGFERGRGETAHLGRTGRLGAHDVLAEHAEADEIARIGEVDDPSPSIEEGLVYGDNAFLDAIDVRARVTLAEHMLLSLKLTLGGLRQPLIQGAGSSR